MIPVVSDKMPPAAEQELAGRGLPILACQPGLWWWRRGAGAATLRKFNHGPGGGGVWMREELWGRGCVGEGLHRGGG